MAYAFLLSAFFAFLFGSIPESGKIACTCAGVVIALIGYRWTYNRIKAEEVRPNPLSWA